MKQVSEPDSGSGAGRNEWLVIIIITQADMQLNYTRINTHINHTH